MNDTYDYRFSVAIRDFYVESSGIGMNGFHTQKPSQLDIRCVAELNSSVQCCIIKVVCEHISKRICLHEWGFADDHDDVIKQRQRTVVYHRVYDLIEKTSRELFLMRGICFPHQWSFTFRSEKGAVITVPYETLSICIPEGDLRYDMLPVMKGIPQLGGGVTHQGIIRFRTEIERIKHYPAPHWVDDVNWGMGTDWGQM